MHSVKLFDSTCWIAFPCKVHKGSRSDAELLLPASFTLAVTAKDLQAHRNARQIPTTPSSRGSPSHGDPAPFITLTAAGLLHATGVSQ